MQITKDTVVQIHYTLKSEQGDILEDSTGHDPIAYLHGHNNMMSGVENSLEGKSAGDEFSVTLPPEETYGEYKEGAEQRVAVKHLKGSTKKWAAGMVAIVPTEEGERQVVIKKIGKFMATVDLNPPLAGKTLTFDLKVVEVRAATEEELTHGHAHGVGGHQH